MRGKRTRNDRKVEAVCVKCGRTFLVVAYRANQPHCSNTCAARRGQANNRFNGGLCRRSDGRTVIVCRDGTLLLYYRGLMAAHIGRLLRSDELVHHVNGDPSDDRIENLRLTTRAEHIEMHRAELLAGAHATGYPTGDDWRARRGLL